MFSISNSNWCCERLLVPYMIVLEDHRIGWEIAGSDLEGKVFEEVGGSVGLVSL